MKESFNPDKTVGMGMNGKSQQSFLEKLHSIRDDTLLESKGGWRSLYTNWLMYNEKLVWEIELERK